MNSLFSFRFSDIGNKGTELSGPLDREQVVERLQSDAFRFEVAPEVSLQLSKNLEGIEVRGTLTLNFFQNCGRCLEDKPRKLEIPLFFLIRRKPKAHQNPHNDNRYEDDIGVYHVDDDHVDLVPFLEEHLVLGLSLYWSPELLPSGNCSLCGKASLKLVDAQEPPKQTLKDLLEAAKKNVN